MSYLWLRSFGLFHEGAQKRIRIKGTPQPANPGLCGQWLLKSACKLQLKPGHQRLTFENCWTYHMPDGPTSRITAPAKNKKHYKRNSL